MDNYEKFLIELGSEFLIMKIPNCKSVIVNVISISPENSSFFNMLYDLYGYPWEAFISSSRDKLDVHFFCDL